MIVLEVISCVVKKFRNYDGSNHFQKFSWIFWTKKKNTRILNTVNYSEINSFFEVIQFEGIGYEVSAKNFGQKLSVAYEQA